MRFQFGAGIYNKNLRLHVWNFIAQLHNNLIKVLFCFDICFSNNSNSNNDYFNIKNSQLQIPILNSKYYCYFFNERMMNK